MKSTSSQLKAKARGNLAGRYALPIIAYMLARIITNIPSLMISYTASTGTLSAILMNHAMSLIVSVIMTIFVVGLNRICLCYARSRDPIPMNTMWYGFKGRADEIILVYFRIFIRYIAYGIPFFLALGLYLYQPSSLLLFPLIITGVFMTVMYVKMELEYGLVYFLISDYPQESSRRLLAHSKELMQGNRRRLLYIQLSFLGMLPLVLLSMGFAIFWVYPYIRMTLTEFYLDLTQNVDL